ncbi:MAG: hypothetical protein ACHP83_05465 [Burkholderiales bacterium]
MSTVRALLVALLLLATSLHGSACDCFPPELRLKTAQETLSLAKFAVYGRVTEVASSGKAKVLVLESFKGPAAGSTIEAVPDPAQCPGVGFAVGEEALVLAFQDTATACDKRAPDHYLLEPLRLISSQAK